MRQKSNLLVLMAFLLTMILAACGGSTPPVADEPAADSTTSESAEVAEPQEEVEPEAEPEEPPAEVEEEAEPEPVQEEMEEEAEPEDVEEDMDESMSEDRTVVRWFVGLGTGQNAEQVEAQEAVVEAFNASQESIFLEMEIVQNDVAYDTLATLIASGNAPDIIGPVGVKGSNAFSGQWADLQPLVDAADYDLEQYPQAAVDFYRVEGEGLIGLPFAVFPAHLFYNKELFDEAGLPYPPQAYGEPYGEGTEYEGAWDWNKVREIGMILTVDENGNDATMAEFNPNSIVQFGYLTMWTDGRGFPTHFGSGNFVDSSGSSTIPDHWREAYDWLYAGIWDDHFIPSQAYQDSDLLGVPNAFASGNLGIAGVHLWFTCCLGEMSGDWDVAVMPSWGETTTAKLHADTFRLLDNSENKEAAFEVLTYLVGEASRDLLAVYGGMPARVEETAVFFQGQDSNYPDQEVNWQVAVDSLNYPDNPSHEGNMPNFNKADERISAFYSLVQSDGEIDLEAEIDTLLEDLQSIFDESES